MMNRSPFFLLTLCVLWLVVSRSGRAAAGDPNPHLTLQEYDFAGGIDRVHDMKVQPDGRIVLAGTVTRNGDTDFAVLRVLPDGSPDPTFNTTGARVVDIATKTEGLGSLALLPDGRILVAGVAEVASASQLALLRFNASGSLDTSFSSDGVAVFAAGPSGKDVVLQDDGKIVVAGDLIGASSPEFAVMRLNADGSPDGDFGSGGLVSVPVGTEGQCNAVALQADGKIVVTGFFDNGATFRDYLTMRFTTAGGLDPDFGTGGQVSLHVDGGDIAHDVAIQSDGKILVSGNARTGVDLVVARLLSNGDPDPSFAIVGYAKLATAFTEKCKIALQPDGKIVASGKKYSGGVKALVARFEADGGLNTTFGSGGVVETAVEVETQPPLPVALQGDGGILLAGTLENGSDDNFFLIGFEGDSPAQGEIHLTEASGAGLGDGASTLAFGGVLTGVATDRELVLRNVGSGTLGSLSHTIVGADAGSFSVVDFPTDPSLAPNGAAVFRIRVDEAVEGPATATLRIGSDDSDENPFDIDLTATLISAEGDEDGDTVTNAAEIHLADAGFDPLVHSAAAIAELKGLGWFLPQDFQALALDRPVLRRDATSGNFELEIGVLKSGDLQPPWLPLTGFSVTPNAAMGTIQVEFDPGSTGSEFYQVFGAQP